MYIKNILKFPTNKLDKIYPDWYSSNQETGSGCVFQRWKSEEKRDSGPDGWNDICSGKPG